MNQKFVKSSDGKVKERSEPAGVALVHIRCLDAAGVVFE